MLDDELTGDESSYVESHVQICRACQDALERLTDVDKTADIAATVDIDVHPTPTGSTSQATPMGSTLNIVPSPDTSFRDIPGGALPSIAGYEIEKEIGRGGMGVVYFGRQIHANRPVALKMLLGGRNRSEDLLRFRLEGESLARLQSPNVVQVFEVGISEGRPFFSMEYVPGGTLADALVEKTLTLKEAAAIVEIIARGVHSAHQCGVVHRDLKPSNILMAKTDGQSSSLGTGPNFLGAITPKVTDFGLAKNVENDGSLTHTGQILGTPCYMAPEQAQGGANVGVLADVYALGAIFYETLAGRPPFKADGPWETMMQVVHQQAVSPKKFRSGLPRDLEVICMKCLSKDPKGRYPSADALANDLRSYLQGEPIIARPAGLRRKTWLWCRRHPVPAALTALLLMSIVGGMVGIGLQLRRAEALLKESNSRFKLALEAVQTFYTGASRDVLMKQPELEDLRKKLLKTPITFYQKLREQLEADADAGPETLAELGDALLNLAKLNYEVGNKDDARESHRQVQKIGEKLVRDDPTFDKGRTLLALALNRGGEVDLEMGRYEQGRHDLKLAVIEFERLKKTEPQVAEHENYLAISLHLLGDAACDEERFDDSEKFYRQALELRRKLVKEHPEIRSYLDGLGGTENNFAILYGQWHKDEEAGEYFFQGLQDRKRLAALEPDDPEYQRKLSSSLCNYGAFLNNSNHLANAAQYVVEALEIQKKLVIEHPTFSLYQEDLAVSHDTLGDLYETLGKYDEARPHFLQALELMRKLAAASPNKSTYQTGVQNALNGLADVALGVRDYQEAWIRSNQCAATYRLMPREIASNVLTRFLFADGLVGGAQALEKMGESLQAEEAYQQTLSAFDAMLENPSGQADEINRGTWSHARASRFWMTLGDFDRAESELKASNQILERLLKDESPTDRNQPLIGSVLSTKGDLALCRGRALRDLVTVESALKPFQSALEEFESSLGKNPEDAGVKLALVEVRESRAEVLTELARYDDAIKDWDAALERVEPRDRNRIEAGRAATLCRAGKVEEGLTTISKIAAETTTQDQETCLALAKGYAEGAKSLADGSAETHEVEPLNLKALESIRKAIADPRTGDGRIMLQDLNDPAFDLLRTRFDFRLIRFELILLSEPR